MFRRKSVFVLHFLVLLGLVGCHTVPRHEGARIVYVMERDYEGEAFESIDEFFVCHEGAGLDAVFRTDPDCRAGHYFLVGLDRPLRRVEGSRVILEYFHPISKDLHRHEFMVSGGCSRWIYIGLTGDCAVPVGLLATAFRVTLETPECVSSSYQSYLW